MRGPETGAGTLPRGNTKERAGGQLHLEFCLYFHYIEQPVLTAISGPGGHARQCTSSPQSHGSGRKQLGHPGPDSQDLLTQTSQTRMILKSRGGARERPGRPSQAPGRMPAVPPGPSPLLPRGTEAPTPRPWPDSQRCATCQLLGLLPAKPAAQSLRLQCHQSFLLCVLDPVQGSRGSCGLGRGVGPGRAGRWLPLRTRATPSWTRTHPHFPGPTETRLALQPNSRKADLYEYMQGPGILARLPHSLRSMIGGGCATARESGALQVLITGVR